MKYLLIYLLCLSMSVSFLTKEEKKDAETIYEEYHEVMLNNFNLTYEGKANNDVLKLTLQEAFPSIFDEVIEIHLYKNTDNAKFKYVYKINGLLEGEASAAAVNANKSEFESLTFTSHCPNSRVCVGECDVCPCNPETPIGVICGCFDEITGTCDVF